MNLERVLKQFDYRLPPELIAQKPASPRDSARLLVYNRASKKINFDKFQNLAKYLPKNAVLVFNQTKVWPARLVVQKPTGGKVEILYISHDSKFIKILANRKLSVGSELLIPQDKNKKTLKVIKKSGQFYFLKSAFPTLTFPKLLQKYGITPLPPYIKHSPLTEKQKRQQYQTIFAKTGLSVAAPTASLHFTKQLMSSLQKQGIAIKFVRLDVGLGTFAALKEKNLTTGKLHKEFYQIDKSTAAFLNRAKKQGRPIIAVGTTVTRTLESSSHLGQGLKPFPTKSAKITKLTGTTDLFIGNDYKFKFIDGLITNFHVPKSSLLMLVSALTGRKIILDLYQQAINNSFRFFSFGDGMFII